MPEFAAQVSEWVKQSNQRMEAVWKQSAQQVYSRTNDYLSGELVGVVTGFLRASSQASTSQMPAIDPGAAPKEGQTYAPSAGQVVAVIANAQLGQTIYIGWTANYAGFVHDGTSKMGPRPFVALAAESWPSIVKEVSETAMSRASQ